MANKTVAPPKGFHWMKAGKSYRLMKGDYTPHTGAVKKASYNELAEEGMKITQDAFMDELHKIAGRGALFSKAIKTIKNVDLFIFYTRFVRVFSQR